MHTSKASWASALLLSCVACGSSFHSADTSAGGDGSGEATSSGGDVASGGDSSLGGRVASGGSTASGGGSSGGRKGSGGDTSSGGVISSGGDVGVAGGSPGGGDVSVSGSTSSGGSAGSAPGGGAGGVTGSAGSSGGSGGSGGVDCTKLWAAYTDLVTKASVCDADVAGECVDNSEIVNACSCAQPVNSKSTYYADAKKALAVYRADGCTIKECPCLAPGGVACTVNASSSYICTSTGLATAQ